MEKPCDTSKLFICTVLYPLWRQLYGTTICHGMSILLAPVIHVLFIQKARPTVDGPSTSANSYSFFLSSASFPACLSFANPVGSADPVPSFSNVLSLYRLYSTYPPSLAPFGAKLSYKLVIQYIVRSFSLLLGKPGILICKPL